MRLSRREVPPGSKILVSGDLHVPIHDERPAKLMLECASDWGVTHGILQGDSVNCGSISPHLHDPDLRHTLREEVESGDFLWDFYAKLQTYFIEGNHEDWGNDIVAKNPGLHGATDMPTLLGLRGRGYTFLPHGGQVRLGSLVFEHGDLIFPRGGGPKHAAAACLAKFPDQSTVFGHIHRLDQARLTTEDKNGITRTRGAFSVGHMSIPEMHHRYAGRNPGWQQGFGLFEIWYDGGEPRFTPYLVEIHRDGRNRPVFNFNGKTYK
jgi:hypothetical protein